MFNSPFRILAQQPVALELELAPLYNSLTSLALLNAAELLPDADPWLLATAAALTPAQRHANRLIFEVFGDLLLIPTPAADMPAYLERLASYDPASLCGQWLERLQAGLPATAPGASADLLANAQARLALLSPLAAPDLALEANRLLDDPAALQQLIAGHLRTLWTDWLEPEWRRRQPLLQSLLAGLRRRDWPSGTASETLRLYLGRDAPPAISAQLDGVRTLVFVLSPHVGGHASRFGAADTLWVFVRGRAEDLPLRGAPVKRIELVNPLAALADETRLQILDLLAHHGPLLAQEVIGQLELSQSSVSRHLKHLRSAGFLTEDRGDGANKRYSFNPGRIDWVFRSLNALLSAEPPAPSAQRASDQPAELRHFLDAEGRVVRWPSKRKIQLLVLTYLIEQFEFGRDYSEKEVNALINRWHTYGDHATLRRELYDAALLNRTGTGSRYWRQSADH